MRRVIGFAPGRVNLIGEHTDYNQGLALPFAIAQGVTVTATATAGPVMEAVAADLRETDVFPVEAPSPGQGWRAFVRGAVGELRAAGFLIPGARLEISGTVPQGAGLGSSAALEVALTLALIGLTDSEPPAPVALAQLCSRIENRWVGARTGLLDQLASLCGQAGHVLRIDFRTLQVTPIPFDLPPGWRLVTVGCGERHDHAASGYNRRREECAQACRLLGLESLRDATDARAAELPAPLDRRVRHVLGANARVGRLVEALRGHDPHDLGALLDEAHVSLRDLYEVSTPAVEATVALLKDAGAAGARLMGGGFGGYVLGLMPPDAHSPAGALEVAPAAGAHVRGAHATMAS